MYDDNFEKGTYPYDEVPDMPEDVSEDLDEDEDM